MREYMANPIISEDGHWMWDGSNWIPNKFEEMHQSRINIQDSVVGNAITQDVTAADSWTHVNNNNAKALSEISIHDSVITGDINVTVNQNVDKELFDYVVQKLESLQLDMLELKTKVDSDKNSKKSLIKDKSSAIDSLTQHIYDKENQSGQRLLNPDLYDQLSTLTMATGNNHSTYFNSALAETARTNEEWFVATKRRLKRVWWIYNLHLFRTPEAIQIMHDIVDDLISGKGDYRIFDVGNFLGGHVYVKGGFVNWFNGVMARKKKKALYDREAEKNPSLPKWSDVKRLRSEYKIKRVKLKEIWEQYEKENNRDWTTKIIGK